MKNMVLVMSVAMILAFGIIRKVESSEVTIIDSGNCGIDGADNCQWSLDSKGKLTVTGSGSTDNYVYSGVYDTPWINHQYDITSVDVLGISIIGRGAFGFLPNLKDVYIDDSVDVLSTNAFWASPIESLRMSDSVKTIGQATFQGNHLTMITLPDTATIAHTSLGGNPELQIICKGSQKTCSKLISQMSKYSIHPDNGDADSIINLSNNVHLANYTNCNSTSYFWDGSKCIHEPDVTKRQCCADVCKDMGGWCNRIRYTPAEAAAAMNGDDNTITITFKK